MSGSNITTILSTEKAQRYKKRLLIIGLIYLLAGLGLLFYSVFFLLASVDKHFENGEYHNTLVMINYILWTIGSMMIMICGFLGLQLQRDISQKRRASRLNTFCKIELVFCTVNAFAIYIVHTRMG